MGRKKKDADEPKRPNATTVRFIDGPRAGTELRIALPVRQYMRFATPEWCTYERVDQTSDYVYVGNIRILYNNIYGVVEQTLDV
jgi:hypothetical protein